jgi:hypothetical protein
MKRKTIVHMVDGDRDYFKRNKTYCHMCWIDKCGIPDIESVNDVLLGFRTIITCSQLLFIFNTQFFLSNYTLNITRPLWMQYQTK